MLNICIYFLKTIAFVYSRCYNEGNRRYWGFMMNFAERVKHARRELGYSQMQFAKELGVSFSSVNRWEQGHTVPHPVFVKVFEDYCEKRSIIFPE